MDSYYQRSTLLLQYTTLFSGGAAESTMNGDEFRQTMKATDRKLSERGIPAVFRTFFAFWEIEGNKPIIGNVAIDPSRSPYEGTNLVHTIDDWYRKNYPAEKATIQGFGERPILIRSELFLVRMPATFNAAPQKMAALSYVIGLTDAFIAILDAKERDYVQHRFCEYFPQMSRLALLRVRSEDLTGPNAGLARDLLSQGSADLHSISHSVAPSNPSAIRWSAQQAVEKFLKAYLALTVASFNAKELKRRFKHDLRLLLAQCAEHCSAFDQVLPHIAQVEVSPDERYRPTNMSVEQALAVIDRAYAICDLVVQILLNTIQTKRR
jgi:hypothetical protein